ncbi:MAG: IPT/TIG domain-containing protein [Bryobacteraceae bacterium]
MNTTTRCAVAMVAVTGAAWAVFAGLSLSIADEIQPPGGVFQMKVSVTEPKPISTGRGRVSLLGTAPVISSIDAVNLLSPAGDAAGVAVISGTNIRLTCNVPSKTFGSVLDFPIMTITGTVSPSAVPGATTPLSISPANLVFLDPTGTPYPEEIKSGTLTVANNVSITDVIPGSGAVPAGGAITIKGMNFAPGVDVRIKEVAVNAVNFISDTELQVILGVAVTNMQGQEITVTNSHSTSAMYYSFQRTTTAGRSSHPLFNITFPIFEYASWSSAIYSLPAASGTKYAGLAIQNLQSTSANLTVLLVSSTGTILGSKAFALPPNKRLVRATSEFITTAAPAGSTWRVRSNLPVQSLGLIGDDGTGVVSPVVPSATQ